MIVWQDKDPVAHVYWMVFIEDEDLERHTVVFSGYTGPVSATVTLSRKQWTEARAAIDAAFTKGPP